MTDHGAAAQKAAEEWLNLLEGCRMAEDDGEEVDWPADLLAPYDGCVTCQVRETLRAAAPHLERGFREDVNEPVLELLAVDEHGLAEPPC